MFELDFPSFSSYLVGERSFFLTVFFSICSDLLGLLFCLLVYLILELASFHLFVFPILINNINNKNNIQCICSLA